MPVLLSPFTLTTYKAAVLADSPLCYLRLGDASGTTAADASGNSHTGTYTASPALGATSLLASDPDTAVTFNGSSQFVSISNTSHWADQTTYTVECWFKTTTTTVSMLCAQYDGTNATDVWQLAILANGGLQFTTFLSGAGTNYNTSTTGYNDGARHHVVVTMDGTTVKILVDNVQRFSGSVASHTASNGVGLYLAERNFATPARFAGTLDEFAFYSGALSSARVAAHFAAA